MSPIHELEACLSEFSKAHIKSEDNIAVKLLSKLTRYVLGQQEAEVQPEEWLDARNFCKKYPIMVESTMQKFIHYSSGNDFIKMEKNKYLFQPNRLFKFIIANKVKFVKTHARLVRNNYFGLIYQ